MNPWQHHKPNFTLLGSKRADRVLLIGLIGLAVVLQLIGCEQPPSWTPKGRADKMSEQYANCKPQCPEPTTAALLPCGAYGDLCCSCMPKCEVR